MTDKFCVKCKHCAYSIGYYTCYHPIMRRDADLVTGQVTTVWCADERRLGWKCGPEGKLWEAK